MAELAWLVGTGIPWNITRQLWVTETWRRACDNAYIPLQSVHMQRINASAAVNLERTLLLISPMHTHKLLSGCYFTRRVTWARDRGVLCLAYRQLTCSPRQPSEETPLGHSGFSSDMKRNVHPSKKISEDPVKVDHLLRKLIFLKYLQPSCNWGRLNCCSSSESFL